MKWSWVEPSLPLETHDKKFAVHTEREKDALL